MFKTELEMSKMFEKFLKVNFGNSYIKEYQGLFGIPDFVFYSKKENDISIIAFELKLKDWKRAAKQAFRYKNFSNVSYVVLSAKSANAAINNLAIFEKYNIGLAKFNDNSEFEIIFKPAKSVPYSESLNLKVLNSIQKSRKKSKNINLLL